MSGNAGDDIRTFSGDDFVEYLGDIMYDRGGADVVQRNKVINR